MPRRRSPSAKVPETPEERTRRGYADASGMTFGLLKPQVLAVEGGFRDARMLDGDFMGWLCAHTHATEQEAEECSEKVRLVKDEAPPGPVLPPPKRPGTGVS